MTADNLAIWNALAKTDPKHTKPFNRSGGFKGTAIKPIWIIRQLTEQFGPCGTGWGLYEPKYEVVHCEGEILVYCTVSGWYETAGQVVWGVGGDKVQAKRSSGPFCDDEAFKKAFTDAVNNAFKFIGVAADVHMGLHDDDKYVSQVREEFAENPQGLTTSPYDVHGALDQVAACDTQPALKNWWDANVEQIPEAFYARVVDAVNARRDQIKTMDRMAA